MHSPLKLVLSQPCLDAVLFVQSLRAAAPSVNTISPSPRPSCSDFGSAQVVIPQPLLDLTTRRVLTMEWVTGVKLTTLQVGVVPVQLQGACSEPCFRD